MAKIRTISRTASTQTNPSVGRLLAIRDEVAARYVGRDEVAEALALGLVANANVLLLGVPGTAKTAIVRTMADSFCVQSGDFFSVLLTKFTTPKEVFGPVDILKLKDGIIEIKTSGYLPSARVGVLDEVFKGSSAIQNSLLTIVNEGIFQNGAQWVQTPLRMVVGMSNEYPEDPALLAAFFDRFPIKLKVCALDASRFSDLLRAVSSGSQTPPTKTQLEESDFDAFSNLRDAVAIPEKIFDALSDIREMLRSKGVTISDRRWVVSLRVLRASAVLRGSSEVAPCDLRVLAHIAWNSDEDYGSIREILPEFADPTSREIRRVMDEVFASRKSVLAAANIQSDGTYRAREAAEAAMRARTQIKSYIARLDDIVDAATGESDILASKSAREQAEAIFESVTAIGLGKGDVIDLAASAANDIISLS